MTPKNFSHALDCAILAVISCLALARPGAAAERTNQILDFAGSGRAGLADGPARSAQFILPSALAVDAHGDLYVTDAAAQRIRLVRAGSVSTLAGSGALTDSKLWVLPGFRNGPALQARFNRPSGIAIGPGGRIYIADTNNHCIRLLRDGTVSTYAGICGTLGTSDGPRTEATFSYPRQLSLDTDGNLYVADFENAVRKVDTQGAVHTIPLQIDKRVTGVQAYEGQLYVADVLGLLVYNTQTGAETRIPATYDSHVFPPPTAFDQDLGSPYQLALGRGAAGVFYSDLRSDTVGRLSPPVLGGFVTYLSGVPQEDAVLGNGWMTSTLNGPEGVALDDTGRLFATDAGHKRIVQITGFERQSGFLNDPDQVLRFGPIPSEYRILIIGNSYAFYVPDSRDSIGALVEKKLREDGALRSSGQEPRVVTLALSREVLGQASLAKVILSLSNFNLVLILTGRYDVGGFAPATALENRDDDPLARKLYRQQETDTVSALNRASIKSLFVLLPDNALLAPLESLYLHENLDNTISRNLPLTPLEMTIAREEASHDIEPGVAPEQFMLEALRSSGAPVLDLLPAAYAYEAESLNKPLFASDDVHPSAFGREFIAAQITSRLEELRPWKKATR